jgi:hypothetical protein
MQSLSPFSHNLWLIMSPILCSQICQVTQAIVLLSVQFPYNFQPSYLGSTSVNYHIHLTGTQYNVMELTDFKRTKYTCSIPSLHRHDHWEKPPLPTTGTDCKVLKERYLLFNRIFCWPSQNQPPPPSEAVMEKCRKSSSHMSAFM